MDATIYDGAYGDVLTDAKAIEVAVDEADCMGRIKPSAYMQYMQDLATDHAELLGVGYHTMAAQGCFWVLTHMSVRLEAQATVGGRIVLRTFPIAPHAVECMRDFVLTDAEGRRLMTASTRWCVIDAQGRPQKARPFFARYTPEQYKTGLFVPDVSDKWSVSAERTAAYTGCVRYSDMDRNHHLNNTIYGDILLDAWDERLLNAHDLAGFDIAFRNQAFYGARYDVFRARDGETLFTEAVDAATGVTLFSARFRLSAAERTEVL